MRWRRHRQEVDDAGLQADVMRFMAIVAFCLVAILAMVRNIDEEMPEASVEPPQVASVEQAPPVEAEPTQPQIVPEPEPVAEVPVVERKEPEPEVFVIEREEPEPEAFVIEREEPRPQRVEAPRPLAPPPPLEEQQPPPPAPEPVELPPLPAVPQVAEEAPEPAPTEPSDEADEGLTLRFESEQDFLRLVARRKVAVYAFNAGNFLELDDSYRFRDARPPGQVYELEVSTIPRHLRDSLPNHLAQDEMKWAVGLPQRVERQIRQYLNEVKSGELLIDRYEQVHHVAAR